MILMSLCHLRPMQESDLPQVLNWRNAPEVRKASLDSRIIGIEEHTDWFRNGSKDETRQSFVFEYEGVSVGVVNLSRIDCKNRQAYWGFYRGDALRQMAGLGLALGYFALETCFRQMRLRRVNAEVLQTNPLSLRFHEKLGFVVINLPKNGVIPMAVDLQHWQVESRKIAGRIFEDRQGV